MDSQPKQEPLKPTRKPDDWYRILDYCIANADSIYVRCCLPSGKYDSIELSHMRFTEVVDQIDLWYAEGGWRGER